MTKREPITDRQAEILAYIDEHTRPTSPTYREIQERFGFRSTNAVVEIVTVLERKGYLRRNGERKARNIEVVR